MLELQITAPGLKRLTERLGGERAKLRDADVETFHQGELEPLYKEPPAVGAISMDGGRAQIRASDASRGVHEPAWTETKVADLVTYRDASCRLDPQPEPPAKFLDPPEVLRLVQEMKGFSGRSRDDGRQDPESPERRKRKDAPKGRKRAAGRRKVRTVVATTQSAEQFGPMVATAPVESLIKRVNRRVKGTEKFWTREGLESVLQVRAAYLSEDGRAEAHWERRPLGRAAARSLFGQRAAA